MASDTSSQQQNNQGQSDRQPEYTKYSSMSHFFNEKRKELLDSTSPSSSKLHHHTTPKTQGERIWPPSSSPPHAPPSPEMIIPAEKKGIDKKLLTVHNPKWWLARRQLMDMWNKEAKTERQQKEFKRVKAKMLAQARKYKVNKVSK